MTTRDRVLDSLRVATPCRSSWEEMQGDARRRFCAECERYVYDLAQLTAREAAGLVEATGGRLCARVTRDPCGRLVTLPSPAPEPLAVTPGSRRSAPLAAAVATVLGLAGAAAAHAAGPAVAPVVEQGDGERPAEGRPRRAVGSAGSLSGTVRVEGGGPIARAEVKLRNLLDGRERTGQTDDQGRFFFAALPAGPYELGASFESYDLAGEEILLGTGQVGTIALSVPAATWRNAVSKGPIEIVVGGAGLVDEPLRHLYAEAGLIAFGTAGRSVVVHREQYTWQIRTDLVLSSVLKGETRERVISVLHEQMADEDPASRLQPGDRVLAFLDPHEAQSGHGWDGYAAHTTAGLRKLSDAETASYGGRLAALARIERRGAPRPDDLLEWLVATAEDPATREEAVDELEGAVWQLQHRAERHGARVEVYAQGLRGVVAESLGTGGRPEGESDPAILGAFLTEAHRERLTAALLGTKSLTPADMALYGLIRRWHDERALPWLLGRIRAGEPADGDVLGALSTAAEDLGDKALQGMVSASYDSLSPLEEKLAKTDDPAARRRLQAELRAVEQELRRRFLAAVGERP